jgi:hypothetical protein
MAEFSESRIPLAYLITFRCYGTWLHGDARGSVDRDHNVYHTPFLSRDTKREHEEQLRLKHAPVELNEARRITVEAAVRGVCVQRGWALHAINVRTNHVHSVVTAGCRPEKILNSKPMRPEECAKQNSGDAPLRPGRKKEADGICGKRKASPEP